jgi:hypothetical protein
VKLNRLFAIVVLAGCLGLAGCKPNTFTGQVFIVTQSRDNIKLGAVEVVLIEKQQVADFLRQRQAAIDDEIKARQSALEIARQETRVAEANWGNAGANFEVLPIV